MNELLLASPILVLSVLAIIALIVDAANEKNSNLGYNFAQFSLLISLGLSVMGLTSSTEWLANFNVQDSLSQGTLLFSKSAYFYDILFCLSAIFSVAASKPYLNREDLETSEFYNLVLFAVSGMMIMSHSAHLLTAFIGIETMSLAFYIMAGYFRFNQKSVEASLKYFLLGAFATGFLVYGMAMIYGATGSFDIAYITQAISEGSLFSWTYLKIGIGMLLVGLAFKVAAFPFHQWAPDVYTGAPTPVTAFMSTAGKAAAIIIFIIMAQAVMPTSSVEEVNLNTATTQKVIAIISAFTMIIGNITALVQRNVKRMLAFSSVAHAGYLLMGIVANTAEGWRGVTFYMTSYLFMQLGSFIIVSVFEREKEKNHDFRDYNGLSSRSPWLAAVMAIFMFSLAGLPPFAGFFGKYLLFTAAIKSGFTWLTIVAVISSIISMYFYIGLVLSMYFKDPSDDTDMVPDVRSAGLPIFISTIVIIVFGILPFFLNDFIQGVI